MRVEIPLQNLNWITILFNFLNSEFLNILIDNCRRPLPSRS